MTGGSIEKESPHDEQCSNCGRWYRGGMPRKVHEASCDGEYKPDDEPEPKPGPEPTQSSGSMNTPGSDQLDEPANNPCPNCGEPLGSDEQLSRLGVFRCSECGKRFEVDRE